MIDGPASKPPWRVMLDSNAYDRVVESEETLDLVRRAVGAGVVQIVSTHIQEDELNRIPDSTKQNRISKLPRSQVATWGVVLGTSRLGEARLDDAPVIDAVRRGTTDTLPGGILSAEDFGNLKHTNDALIVNTAMREGLVFVTEERRLPKKLKRLFGMDSLTVDDFVAEVKARMSGPGSSSQLP